MEDLTAQAQQHWLLLDQDHQQMTQPVSLSQALVLGVDRNIDYRVASLERALATSNQKLASMSMLPSLTAAAGYTYRDRVAGSFSESISSGQVSLESSTSLDSRRSNTSLEMSWNVLDFAMAWHRTRTLGDQVRVAEEQRIRMLHNTSREIVYAWDMVRAYQRTIPEMQEARQLIEQALARSSQLESLRLQDPLLVLDYRRSLMLLQQQVNRMFIDMEIATDELARLLNLPAGAAIVIDENADPLASLPAFSAPIDVWQRMGLLNRPEVRAVFYEKRAADRSATETLLQAMPAAAVRYGVQTDSNSYTLNKRWQEGGVQLSWNLMQLASYPARRRQVELQKERAQLSASLQMTAVMSQVVIAGKQMENMRRNACLARNLLDVESRRVSVLTSRQQQAAIDRLSVIKARLDHLLIRLEAEFYHVEQRRSMLTLLSSIGFGLVPDVIDATDPEEIESLVQNWIEVGLLESFSRLRDETVERFDLPASDQRVLSEMRECEE
jgi:outer membrane protein TolC